MVAKWIFHRPWNYIKTASKFFEITIWALMPTEQLILWKKQLYLNSFLFGINNYDSGFQQMGLTLDEIRVS